MSAIEAVSRPGNPVAFDRVLLAVLSMLLLAHAGLYYVCLRFNLPFAFALAWSTSDLVLGLGLPESIASAVIENFFMLIVGQAYALILTIRFVEIGTWKSPSLLACVVLLVLYHFGGAHALDYCFDQVRFQLNRSAYLAMAREGDGWPDSAIVNWGESGFLDTSIQYYLVMDRTGALARGEIKPEEFGWKSEHMKCGGLQNRLSSDFYSITVWCVGT
ncbi:hypothetical protein [Bradyrhizobium sp.]|uniref:hypothetical protein n=1 Tax=Bradyrhizobium sp. TaxID=376 RepID=UPI0025BC5071|nr:hypothetical protein [Bradyrhizobium sp.]